ncbi:putative acetyltransferase/putative hydrolases of HD superfamily [Acinetobacter kyonggiensis]|uniref:Putative acetyltransferase/putative hydrolases of HD superfamily n=1 Tax=Acinetobacter kyonggiensis TaxID=595670 RepID=A0A1H3FYM4_9GAMM|nr:putative acetyltransferase/putative hydrolases of HD superfamily [Acinetobacter kyonggiensis]
MLQNLIIRNESLADHAAISHVIEQAFNDQQYSSHTEQFIVHALRDAQQLTIVLVAVLNQEIVGHIAISPVSISSAVEGWFGLGPIAVSPKWQHHGVGSALINTALKQLKATGAAGCVVLGDPHFYAQFGFQPINHLILDGVPAEYFQALSFDGKFPQGIVTYHAAFSAT